MTDAPTELARALLRDASHIVVLTGAGTSAESGIPTFRDAMDGLWARYDPMELATIDALRRDPALVTRWYDERRVRVLGVEPNEGHLAIAALATKRRVTLLTQNVDGLHRRAGSDAHELHGSITTWRGIESGTPVRLDAPIPQETFPPPFHDEWLRPGVVLFGETLPEDVLEVAFDAMASCDVMLVVGTSAVVHPVAGFVDVAKGHGASLIEVNPVETPKSPLMDVVLRASASIAIPELIEGLE